MDNVIIDFGNIWEALSAIGTVGAVIFSLWQVNKKEYYGKVELVNVISQLNGQLAVLIENNSDKTLKVINVKLYVFSNDGDKLDEINIHGTSFLRNIGVIFHDNPSNHNNDLDLIFPRENVSYSTRVFQDDLLRYSKGYFTSHFRIGITFDDGKERLTKDFNYDLWSMRYYIEKRRNNRR